MKIYGIIVVLIVILVGGYWYSAIYKPAEVGELSISTTIDPVQITSQQSVALCYMREFVGADPQLGPDRDIVRYEVASDGSLSGNYSWIPAGKDSARGALTGTLTHASDGTQLISASYNYVIEGSNQQQEWRAKVVDQGLLLAEGELVEESGSGVTSLVYKDVDSLKYEKLLPEVDCSVVDPLL